MPWCKFFIAKMAAPGINPNDPDLNEHIMYAKCIKGHVLKDADDWILCENLPAPDAQCWQEGGDTIFSLEARKSSEAVTAKDENLHQGTSESSESSSLEVAFKLIPGLIPAQLTRLNALDTKVNFALGTATALVALAFAIKPSSPSASPQMCLLTIPVLRQVLPPLFLLALLIAYIVVLVFAYRAYRIVTLFQVPTPRALLDKYVYTNVPASSTKEKLLRIMTKAYERNENTLNTKADLINFTFTGLAVESVLLVLFFLSQTIC